MPKRTAVAAILLTGWLLSTSAHAAVSVNLVYEGSPVLSPGSLITLVTYVTSNGGETDIGVLGNINYQDAFLNPNLAGNSQVNLSTVGDAQPGWSSGGLVCTTQFCVAFNQVKTSPVGTAGTAGLTSFPISTTTFFLDPTTPIGTVLTFSWRTTPSTQGLDWFGVTNAAGCTLTVGFGPNACPIPEPATGALLAVGLLGLAGAARRRR